MLNGLEKSRVLSPAGVVVGVVPDLPLAGVEVVLATARRQKLLGQLGRLRRRGRLLVLRRRGLLRVDEPASAATAGPAVLGAVRVAVGRGG